MEFIWDKKIIILILRIYADCPCDIQKILYPVRQEVWMLDPVSKQPKALGRRIAYASGYARKPGHKHPAHRPVEGYGCIKTSLF